MKLVSDWFIERISEHDCILSQDKAALSHPGLEAVRAELFTRLTPESFKTRYTQLLAIDKDRILEFPVARQRSAEAYWIKGEHMAIGVLILHFYSWSILAPQLCIAAERQNQRNKTLWLARFEELIGTDPSPVLAAEVAAIWVAPQYRNHGIGSHLFDYAFEAFDDFLNPADYVFLAVRSQLEKKKSSAIFHHLIANENYINGYSPKTGQIRVTGIKVNVKKMSEALKFDCRHLPIHYASAPTVSLAQNENMTFVGYFKSANPIYGRPWQ